MSDKNTIFWGTDPLTDLNSTEVTIKCGLWETVKDNNKMLALILKNSANVVLTDEDKIFYIVSES